MTPIHIHTSITPASVRFNILRRLLDGSDFAAAMMPWQTFGPIRFADDDERRALIDAHLRGSSAVVTFAPLDKPYKRIKLDALQLAAYTPRADSFCGWIAFDLDGDSHGAGGLCNPDRAASCIAERADAAGVLPGLLIVKSRSGVGRHVWLILSEPIPLDEACIGAAALAVHARRIADRDALDFPELPHAFACHTGQIASVGQSGAFEVFPRANERPARGYPLVLPFGGVAAKRGGGMALDVFSQPARLIEPSAVPVCDGAAWRRLINETRAELARRTRWTRHAPVRRTSTRDRRLDPRTQQLIDGSLPEGQRNRAAYFAYRDLIRSGASVGEAEHLIVAGAVRCGLSKREAESTVQSARRRWGDRP
jgi:hypothetical protein